MSGEAGLRKALEVLDTRVQALEALLAHELRIKDDLRSRQNAITNQGRALVSCLQEKAATEPTSFRFHELRLRKLVEDQRNLQPTLAKAAIQRQKVQKTLQSLLRQRLGLSLQLDKMTSKKTLFQTEEERLQVLFEMKKRV